MRERRLVSCTGFISSVVQIQGKMNRFSLHRIFSQKNRDATDSEEKAASAARKELLRQLLAQELLEAAEWR